MTCRTADELLPIPSFEIRVLQSVLVGCVAVKASKNLLGF